MKAGISEMLFTAITLMLLLVVMVLIGAIFEASGKLNVYLIGFCLGMLFYPVLIEFLTKLAEKLKAWRS